MRLLFKLLGSSHERQSTKGSQDRRRLACARFLVATQLSFRHKCIRRQWTDGSVSPVAMKARFVMGNCNLPFADPDVPATVCHKPLTGIDQVAPGCSNRVLRQPFGNIVIQGAAACCEAGASLDKSSRLMCSHDQPKPC